MSVLDQRDCDGGALPVEARHADPGPVSDVRQPDVAGERRLRELREPRAATDRTFLARAYDEAAGFSDDPATRNGSVIVADGKIVGVGANRFPPGLRVLPERLERPLKYDYMLHAEEAACIAAGHQARGATLYCPWYACTSCAKTIIAHGVRRVVGHAAVREFGEAHSPGWTDSIRLALEMLTEAAVICDWFTGPVPGPVIVIGGARFNPMA